MFVHNKSESCCISKNASPFRIITSRADTECAQHCSQNILLFIQVSNYVKCKCFDIFKVSYLHPALSSLPAVRKSADRYSSSDFTKYIKPLYNPCPTSTRLQSRRYFKKNLCLRCTRNSIDVGNLCFNTFVNDVSDSEFAKWPYLLLWLIDKKLLCARVFDHQKVKNKKNVSTPLITCLLGWSSVWF